MNINANDLLRSYDINIDTKKSEPACMECLPPKPLKDHKSLSGMLIHERIDCPPGVMYMVDYKLLGSQPATEGKK